MNGFKHNKCFTFKLCRGYCVSSLEKFGPIAGVIESPLHNHFSGVLHSCATHVASSLVATEYPQRYSNLQKSQVVRTVMYATYVTD